MAVLLPNSAKAVVIGGGVVGCSVAYHLAKIGWKDIILLERKQLTCGTTWHAAGLVGQLRSSMNLTSLAKYTTDLYSRLEVETDINMGYKQNGSLSLALNEDRYEELSRGYSMAKICDLEVHRLSPKECLEIHPHINIDGVVGGVFIPKDGQIDPANVTQALAKAARALGVRIFENTPIEGITHQNGQVTGVRVAGQTIESEYVVNCAGMWAYDVGKMAGVNVPLHACEHFYIVTEPIAELNPNSPVLRVPDECAYYKEDAGKILLGAFERNAKAWGFEGIPESFCFDQLPDDFEHFEPILEQAINRFPLLEKAGIHTFFNGPESFTPDNRYLLGEAPELRNFYVAAGFNSIGIQSAGGAGKALAEWMDAGEPPFDLWDVDIRRMLPFQGNRYYVRERAEESLGLLYDHHYPYRQYVTRRGIRRSPLHDRLAKAGACFGETAGWERANWFLPQEAMAKGEEAKYHYSWKRQNWFDYAKAEHMAVRQSCGMFDMTSFAKFRVEGRDALDFMQYICAANVDVRVNRVVYTQWLNNRGGIEADLTVTRLKNDAFLVVTAAASAQRDITWLRRHLPSDAHVVITDVTSAEAVICMMGPKSREILQNLTYQSLAHKDFAFGRAKNIDIDDVTVRAHRISYVGELGWELYVPSDMAVRLFDILMQGDNCRKITLCGMHVLDSCRLEKAYRHFGHDITDEDHVLEAGLGFAVSMKKPHTQFGAFIGKQAIIEKKEHGLKKQLLQFMLEDSEPLLYHHEPIWRDDVIVGYTSSANYGHYLGAAIAMGYVAIQEGETAMQCANANYEIEVAGERVKAKATTKAFYDPQSLAMRA